MGERRPTGSRALRAVAAAALAAAALAAAPPARAEAIDGREAAHRALQHGDRMLRAGHHADAIASWRAGLRALPHWALLLRIGEAYRRLDRCDLALPYLAMGWTWRGGDFTGEMGPALEEAIADCTARQPATLEISASRGGVTVSLDDRVVGATPLDPLEVEPGRHVVRGERDDLPPVQTAVRATPGEATYVHLELAAPDDDDDAAGGAAEADDTRARAAARRRRGRAWGGVLLGTALALAAGGAVLIWLDGREIPGEQGLASLAPGVALVGLGGAFVAGGTALLVTTPPGRE
jgi:hypothetical protein